MFTSTWAVSHFTLVALATLGVMTLATAAQERDRSKIDDKYKWNLADIYPSESVWRAAKDKLAAAVALARRVPRQADRIGQRAG